MLELSEEERIGRPPPTAKIHIFHDLNMQWITEEEVKREVLKIAMSRQRPIRRYVVKTYLAHHLQETLDRFGHEGFLNRVRERDIIVLNVLTNDCRDTRNSRRRTIR